MACATLKRTLEFDPVHSPGRPSKRPRCTPMCVSPTSSSPPPAKKSIFDAPKMTPDEMAASIRYEIERLKRRSHRNIDHSTSMSMSPAHSEGSNSDSESMPMSPEPQHTEGSLNHHPSIRKDTLFTYKQVQQICSRIVREREDQLRQEYDEILNSKLSEQYDTFLKFSRDQIQRHFSPDSTPSSAYHLSRSFLIRQPVSIYHKEKGGMAMEKSKVKKMNKKETKMRTREGKPQGKVSLLN